MKKLFFLLCLSYSFLAEAQTVWHLNNGDTFFKDEKTGDKILKPGDTIILPEKGGFIYPGVLQGTPEKPIRILPHPKGTTLTAGIDLRSPQNVIIEGNKKILIQQAKDGADITKIPDGVGVAIYGKAENVTVSGIVFRNVGMGFKIKNEPSCDKSLNEWVIRGIHITDCEATNVRWEWLYGGSTDLGGGRANLNCADGKTVAPPLIGSWRILRNKISRSGRAAVQVSLSSEGVTEIAYNKIEDAGLERSTEQGNGINIGGLSKVWVHDNTINRTFTHGIASLGGIDVTIENNKIDNSGWLFPESPIAWAWSILVVTRGTNPVIPTRFSIVNNITGKRGTGGPQDKGWEDIYVGDDVADGSRFVADGNFISGNTSMLTGKASIVKLKQDKIRYSDKVIAPPPVGTPTEDNPVQQEIILQIMKDGTIKWRKG